MSQTNPILKNYALFGILFTFIVGSLFHSIYELSGSSQIVGYFFPINESVWEHLKLGFYAWLLYGISNYFFLNDKANNYWLGIFLAGLATNLFNVLFFYTYTGILGYSILALDIASYLVSCIIGAYVYYKVLTLSPLCPYIDILGILLLFLSFLLFAFFTYNPPNLPLFKPSSTTQMSITLFNSDTVSFIY